jgi:prevent-host-death family protein
MKPEDIGAFAAKTRLSELLERVRQGRVYRITKRGRPVAELRPVSTAARKPRRGVDRGRVSLREDFDAPVPDFEPYSK